MLAKWLHAYKLKKLRLRVWEKRLLRQLKLISNRFPAAFQCSLHLSWGPFYGGSVILNRKGTKAKIYIHIPYDGYLTPDEQQVLAQYEMGKHALPYFVFFHECYHLLDALAQLRSNRVKDLAEYAGELKRAAKASTPYRFLHVERRADHFAYRQYKDLCEKAG